MQQELKAAMKDFGIGTPATEANRAKLDAMLKAVTKAQAELTAAKAVQAAKNAAKRGDESAPIKTCRVKLLPAQGEIEALALDASRDRLLVLSRGGRSLHFRFVVVILSTGQAETVVERDGREQGDGFQARGLGLLPDGRFVTSVYEVKGSKGRVSPWIIDVDARTLTPPAADAPWRTLESTSIVSLGEVRLSTDGTQATVNLDHVDTTWSLGANGFTMAPRAEPAPNPRFVTVSDNVDAVTATFDGKRVTRKHKRGLKLLGDSPTGVVALNEFKGKSRVLDVRSGRMLFEKDLRMRSPVGAVDASGSVAAFGYGTDVQLVAL